MLRAAAGNHEAALDELRDCGLEHPALGGENPAVLAWRSAAALSLAELGRHREARELAADEVSRAHAFGARARSASRSARRLWSAPAASVPARLSQALSALAASPARLEHARVLVDLRCDAPRRRTAQRRP